MKNPLILIFILVILVVGGLFYIYYPEPIEYKNEEAPVVCTQEAKLCPDGSYVGRVPPNCEFEKCREINTQSQ